MKVRRILTAALLCGILFSNTVLAQEPEKEAFGQTKQENEAAVWEEQEKKENEAVGQTEQEKKENEAVGQTEQEKKENEAVVWEEQEKKENEAVVQEEQEQEKQESEETIEETEEPLGEAEGEWASVEVKEQTVADLSGFTNTLENLPVYGKVRNSYLSPTGTGYQAVLVDAKIHILDFDKEWNPTSEKTLDYELPIFGGYYSGQTYNYLVFGQSGTSAGAEIYRVVKYDKSFRRIAALSVPYETCFTSVPFDAGNVSIAESGDNMVVYTSRHRPDGHQSNIALRINTASMTISNNYGMIDFPDVHVSHSFRQIVKYDGSVPIYADLGDAAPRAVCLQQGAGMFTSMLDIEGQYGDNVTNTDVSGMEVTDTGYLVVGTQIRNYCNNIYLSYVKKGESAAKVTWLTTSTSYKYSNACNAKIIKVSDGIYAVMWNCFDNGEKVNYVMVNGKGEPISALKTCYGAELTQCEPILDNGKITWIKYTNGVRKICSLTDLACTGTFEWNDTYVSPVDPWDGTIDTGWYQDGKKEFTLSSPSQLAGLAKLVNEGNTFEGKKVLLGKDMFFNEADSGKNTWIPIASVEGKTFEGVFDGQGRSLYNFYGGGLFGTIGEKGVVKAVQVSQGYIEGAAIARQNNGWILFCRNNSLVYGSDHSAGICSENLNLVYGCGNSGIIDGRDAAGIVSNNRSVAATIDSCWNQGYVGGLGFDVAGIASSNYGWVYDCYNAGTISGIYMVNNAKNVGGIVGSLSTGTSDMDRIYSCYNTGYLDIDTERTLWRDTICGNADQDCIKNVYSIFSVHNRYAAEVTNEELKASGMIERLRGDKIIEKWCADKDNLNGGQVIPIAQQDMKDGVYKMLPDVWDPVTEVSIDLADGEYQLRAYSSAYYGVDYVSAVYSSNSDILSIDKKGKIIPKKTGTATVRVTFEESEYGKETGFDVKVTITGTEAEVMRGDVNGDKKIDLIDLMMCLNHVSKKKLLEGGNFSAADVDGNKEVNLVDLMRILNYVSKKSNKL